MECLQAAPWPFTLFWCLAVVFGYVVAKNNQFGIKGAILAAIGVKKSDRSFLINILSATTILVPLGCVYWVITTCGN